MEGFFPEKFLDADFWDESPENQSDFLRYTEIPRIGSGQESFHVGSSSQNSKDEDEAPPAAASQSDFLQHGDFLRVGFGQESSQNALNSNQSAFVQYSDLTGITNMKDNGHGASPPANRSAFVQYRDLPRIGFGQGSSNFMNTSRRMIDFLRKSCPIERSNMAEYERERGFRHMLNERMRRQRQRQCCLALHSMLPFGTKNDINSVIQMAAKEIQRLQACRDELKRQNFELEANVKAVEGSKVEFRVPHPTSPIDSVLDILQFLKGLGMNTRSIKSNISPQELFAMLETEAKIGDAEVEKAIQGALNEK